MPSDRIPHAYPQFTNVEDERQHRKQRLAAAFRLFGHFGFDEGVAGHITARDPEHLDHFWVNPLGMNFKQIRVKDLLLVNHEGEVVDGTWPVDAAAWWFITMERTCQAQLLAESAGTPVLIDAEHAATTATQVGGKGAGWRAFQPLYDWIVEKQPDLLDA